MTSHHITASEKATNFFKSGFTMFLKMCNFIYKKGDETRKMVSCELNYLLDL